MNQTIMIIAELAGETIPPVTYELIAFAKLLQNHINLPVKLMAAGHGITAAANRLAGETGFDVIVISSEDTSATPSLMLRSLPAEAFFELNPVFICMAHNSLGIDMASGLAVGLGAGCITGVEKITSQNGRMGFHRKIFNDKIDAILTPALPITVLTIQPGAFTPTAPISTKKGDLFFLPASPVPNLIRHIGYISDKGDTSSLMDAEVIVSAGNGIGNAENLDLIYQLADLFPKSAVAGSRPVCDKKWLAYHQQVGATGATVKPKLYIAAGISGASQHIAGMRDSRLIVAINTDPHAAIFNFSDICIIEDLESFIPLVVEAYQKSEPP